MLQIWTVLYNAMPEIAGGQQQATISTSASSKDPDHDEWNRFLFEEETLNPNPKWQKHISKSVFGQHFVVQYTTKLLVRCTITTHNADFSNLAVSI